MFKNKRWRLFVSCCLFQVAILSAFGFDAFSQEKPESEYDLRFSKLADKWDEGIPLGNAMIGSLVWQKDGVLRMSLDHVGLWDLRSKPNIKTFAQYNFKWVEQQVLKRDYKPVQDRYVPYGKVPYPTKIPGGALEFDSLSSQTVSGVRLFLNNALCEVNWQNGTRLQAFVHASENIGWFRFENAPENVTPKLVPPDYSGQKNEKVSSGQHANAALKSLGYEQGTVIQNENAIVYHQDGSNGFYYEIAVAWQRNGNNLEGVWTIHPANNNNNDNDNDNNNDNTNENNSTTAASEHVKKSLQSSFAQSFESHGQWWKNYWAKSSVTIPDAVLAKQYYNEMYKFGSAARSYAPPISLQAVWTADNGSLPPWAGDYHHDLNTQLSYWGCYAGNRLEEGLGYLNWLWDIIPESQKFTREYFGADGLNVGGVTTIQGEPMGGWIQYSMSPTTSAWLAQHFYLHWQYSRDKEFLEKRAYPYLRDVAVFLDQISVRGKQNKRKLPISSSPEIYNNSLKAWFLTTTNYDLALIRFVYTAAEDCARELGRNDEADRWSMILSEWTDFDLDKEGALTFAKDFPYNESHRHFSNQMAIHPLNLIDRSNGETDRKIIDATIRKLESCGTDWWCGYSYAWLGNIKARNFDGDGAAKALKIFAEHFCLPNTFHANGDQTKQGYSKYTYRPFTLEGNFAFAAGIHEMLIQSHTGIIQIFPAIPNAWQDVSFQQLRTVGAFLVSAERKDGKTRRIKIQSLAGERCVIQPNFNGAFQLSDKSVNIKEIKSGQFEINLQKGQEVILEQK
ncbi:MAG: glycoside hydrolase family 95 protein [Planctomycetaceae bacterium]|nr:glycoside hydrolase family 95 protein [Planctomycetaceae bacterium]